MTRNFSRAACIHRVGELDMNTVLCGETCSEMSTGKTNNKMEKRIVRICRSFFSELSIGKTKNTMGRQIVRIKSLYEMSMGSPRIR